MKISKATAKDFIQSTNGRIFTATYKKKDASERTMNCRLGVRKGVTGAGMKYNPAEYNLIPVYDMQNNGFRMVNLSTITKLTIADNTYEVVDDGE